MRQNPPFLKITRFCMVKRTKKRYTYFGVLKVYVSFFLWRVKGHLFLLILIAYPHKPRVIRNSIDLVGKIKNTRLIVLTLNFRVINSFWALQNRIGDTNQNERRLFSVATNHHTKRRIFNLILFI